MLLRSFRGEGHFDVTFPELKMATLSLLWKRLRSSRGRLRSQHINCSLTAMKNRALCLMQYERRAEGNRLAVPRRKRNSSLNSGVYSAR